MRRQLWPRWSAGLALVLLVACSESGGTAELVTSERPADDHEIAAELAVDVPAEPLDDEPSGAAVELDEVELARLAWRATMGRQDVAPEAEFEGSSLAGESPPVPVTFRDLSTGAITSWSWSFGDGELSREREPTHAYLTSGVYTVGLTVRGPAGVSQRVKHDFVNVAEPAPAADFTATPVIGVAPLEVVFGDLSEGLVTSWSWSLGDGSASNETGPTHTYVAAGSYKVTLVVEGPGGRGTSTREAFVRVTEPPPVAAFVATPTTGAAPLAVEFTDESTGAVTAWSWDFGDGSTSTEPGPAHVYEVPGTYTVDVTVTGPGGTDVETSTDLVVVVDPPPVADLAASSTTGAHPLSVDFTDLSTGPVSAWSWTFGDGQGSTQANPTHEYAAAGTYDVGLTVTGPGGTDAVTKTGYVTVLEPPPVAGFTASPTSGVAPFDVAFSDTSAGIATAWSWDFGDGGASSDPSPVHTYSVPGTYTVALTVAGPGGSDVASRVDLVTVLAPTVADFAATPAGGPAPLVVLFTDLSTGDVTSWSWDFGDGGTSTAADPLHTYEVAGTYSVTLTTSGPGGTDVATKTDLVTASDPPIAAFGSVRTSGTAPLEVAFTDLSTGDVTGWAWDFGDGGSSTAQHPKHTYAAAGTFTVSLTTTGPGGTDTDTRADFVVVSEAPPVASFEAAPTDGAVPLDVVFTDLSSGGSVTSWSWDFGDGGSSSEASPTHTYGAAGTYSVTLTVSGPGGRDTVTRTDRVTVVEPPPEAELGVAPASGNAPLEVSFTDASTGTVTAWSWSFGDGRTSSAQHPVHEYTEPGTYTVTLVVTGPGGTDRFVASNAVTVDPATGP